MFAIFGSLGVIPWILFAQSSWWAGTAPVVTAPVVTAQGSESLRDQGHLFGTEAVAQFHENMQLLGRYDAHILVETVRSLDGAWVADVARQRAALASADALYVLIADEEREVGVVGARQGPASRLTDSQRESIRRAFLAPLVAGNADASLGQGAAAGVSLLKAAAEKPSPTLHESRVALGLLVGVFLATLYWQHRVKRRSEPYHDVAGGPMHEPSRPIPPPQFGWREILGREVEPPRPASPAGLVRSDTRIGGAFDPRWN